MTYELVLPSRRVPANVAVELAVTAEEHGWRGLWCSEVLSLDTIALLAAVGARTTRMRLGTAIVPINTRSAALLAMGAATVAQLVPKRFWLGLGVSTPALLTDRHDRPVERPLTEARGTLEVVRRALRGEIVDHDDAPRVSGLRIEPPTHPPPIGFAALGPKMTQVAIEEADGLVLNLCTLNEAARRSSEARLARGDAYETLMMVRLSVDPTADDVLAARRELAGYARVSVYSRLLQSEGIDLDAVLAADDVATAAHEVSDEMLRELTVLGDRDQCRARLEQFEAAGITPLVVPIGGIDGTRRVIDSLA